MNSRSSLDHGIDKETPLSAERGVSGALGFEPTNSPPASPGSTGLEGFGKQSSASNIVPRSGKSRASIASRIDSLKVTSSDELGRPSLARQAASQDIQFGTASGNFPAPESDEVIPANSPQAEHMRQVWAAQAAQQDPRKSLVLGAEASTASKESSSFASRFLSKKRQSASISPAPQELGKPAESELA